MTIKRPIYGLGSNRFSREPLEKKFADAWIKENDPDKRGTVLDSICSAIPDGLGDRDWLIANTVIQWLGSSVGQAFLSDVMGNREDQ